MSTRSQGVRRLLTWAKFGNRTIESRKNRRPRPVPGAERIRAGIALQSLLIYTSVSFLEIYSFVDQLSSEECRLLSCAREGFSHEEFFYCFAVGVTGDEEEYMRKVGALHNPGLTEELYKLWNCLVNIKSKVKFLAGEPIPTLIIEEQGRYEDATKAIKQLVVPLLSQDQMMPPFVTSWTECLLSEHRLLWCIMFQTFPKPRELYDLCFKRREPDLHQWEDVQRQYFAYTGKAATLPEIRLTLETILGLVYWSRMLKDQSRD